MTRRHLGGWPLRTWLSIFVGVTSIALLGCAGDPSPQVVSLADLVAEPDAYDGSTVIAEGAVQTHDQPRHYWIEDTDQHRVELFPHDAVVDLVGQRVRVTGRFMVQDDRGRGIDIDGLEVLGEAFTASPIRSSSTTTSSRPMVHPGHQVRLSSGRYLPLASSF